MPQNLTDDKSTLVQVMAWCCQATSHYLHQCWSRSPMPYGVTKRQWELIGPWKFELNFRHVIFKQILVIGVWGISCEIALIWVSLDFTDDQSTLVQVMGAVRHHMPGGTIWRHRSGSTLAQVMAWCLMAPSHYLNQCWLLISAVQSQSAEGNFTRYTSAINYWKYLEIY